MASDVKKAKTEAAPKKEAAPKTETPPKTETASKTETVPKKETAADKSATAAEPAKSEASESAGAAPKNYSRGEGQKPVTQAYKDNWNAIFAKKPAKKKKR